MQTIDRDRVVMAELAMKLRAAGVSDKRLLSAIETIPRRIFLSSTYQANAYLDQALPIECGQTLNAPSTVAMVISALGVTEKHNVLEIGCGSGYQAAILGRLAAKVTTIDRYRTLVELAEDRFTALKTENISALVGDGFDGFTRHAPYDRIVIDGSVEKVPPAVIDQLADKGVLIAPIGTGPTQVLTRFVKEGRLFHRAEIGMVRYVPLVEGVARAL